MKATVKISEVSIPYDHKISHMEYFVDAFWKNASGMISTKGLRVFKTREQAENYAATEKCKNLANHYAEWSAT